MRPGQNNKQRMRSRNNNPGNRRGPNPLTRSYESNGPDVKVRGTAHHVGEKYLQLARDAQSSGDPVMAESYLQHAEHYFRIIAAAQLQQLQAQEGYVRPEGVEAAEEPDDDDLVGGLPDRFASPLERNHQQPAGSAPQPVFNGQPNPYQARPQNERPYGDRQPPQERVQGEAATHEGAPQERQPQRQDEDRPRYERPQRQDRFQQNRYGQDRQQGQQGQDRQQGQAQGRDFRQDRNRNPQDRNPQNRDDRPPRDFRPRRDANGEREPRAFQPDPAQEGAILPSFITAPTRVIAPAESQLEQPDAFSQEAPPVNAGEAFAPAERTRRRRARPGLEEQGAPTTVVSEGSESGD